MIQLTTRDVEKIVAHAFDVHDVDKLALRARLENLRKKGCPSGLATGRGKVAKFDFEQLTDVSVALALIDAGLSPDYAVLAVEDEGGVIRRCLAQLALQGPSDTDLQSAFKTMRWPEEDTVSAKCSVHRLLSNPNDEAVRVASWTTSFAADGKLPSDTRLSAVEIDIGTLFVRLVNGMASVLEQDRLDIADQLLLGSA